MYMCYSLPLELAGAIQLDDRSTASALNYVLEISFIVDVCLNFLTDDTADAVIQGKRETAKVAFNYLSGECTS